MCIRDRARINYAYKGKYMLTVASRWDGSSKFQKDNRWGIDVYKRQRVYNIKDFGAKEGNNGEIFCHEAINLAILTCSQAGGGDVYKRQVHSQHSLVCTAPYMLLSRSRRYISSNVAT